MTNTYVLDAKPLHYSWDNTITPRLTIDAGDTVVFSTIDAGDGFYNQDSTSKDIEKAGPFKGHPLTGPVYVRDAAPGGVLAIKIVAMELA